MKILKLFLVFCLLLSVVFGGYHFLNRKYKSITDQGIGNLSQLSSQIGTYSGFGDFLEDKKIADIRNESFNQLSSLEKAEASYDSYLSKVLQKRQNGLSHSLSYDWVVKNGMMKGQGPAATKQVTAGQLMLSLPEPNFGSESLTLPIRTSLPLSGFVNAANANILTLEPESIGYSYNNARRYLAYGRLPPAHTINPQDFINAFEYHFADPAEFLIAGSPVVAEMEMFPSPWHKKGRIVRTSVMAEKYPRLSKSMNLIFLIDRSISMYQGSRMSLLRDVLPSALQGLGANDTVTIFSYGATVSLNLPLTRHPTKEKLETVFKNIQKGARTQGRNPLEEVYGLAADITRNNRSTQVIILTDDDYNITGGEGVSVLQKFADLPKRNISTSIYALAPTKLSNKHRDIVAQSLNARSAIVETGVELYKQLRTDILYQHRPVAQDLRMQVKFSDQIKAWRLIGYTQAVNSNISFMNTGGYALDLSSGDEYHLLYEVVPKDKSGVLRNDAVSVLASYVSAESDEEKPSVRIVSGKMMPMSYKSSEMYFMILVSAFAQYLSNDPNVMMQSYERILSHLKNAVYVLKDPEKNDFLQMVVATQNASFIKGQ